MKPAHLAMLGLVLATTSCTHSPAINPALTNVNTKAFTATAAPGWTICSEIADRSFTFAPTTDSAANKEGSMEIHVIVDPADLEDQHNAMKTQYSGGAYELLDDQPVTVDGAKGFALTYRQTIDGPFKGCKIEVEKGSNRCAMELISDDAHFDANKKAFDQFVASVRIK